MSLTPPSAPVPDQLVSSTDLHAEGKSIITSLSLQMAGAGHRLTLDDFRAKLEAAGYDIPRTTLTRWRARYLADPTCFYQDFDTGRPSSLDEEAEQLMTGFVLHKGTLHEPVSYVDVNTFLLQELGITIHDTTTRLYCDSNGLSNLVAKVRSAAQAHTSAHQQVLLGLEFIEQLADSGLFDQRDTKICCMDVTTTTRRNFTIRTLAPVGRCVFV